MQNRRTIVKSVLLAPFCFLSGVKSEASEIEKIADYIEEEFVKALHKKNEVIESFSNVQIFHDESLRTHHPTRDGFYGYRQIQLPHTSKVHHEISCDYMEQILDMKMNEEQKNLIYNNYNDKSFIYGYSVDFQRKFTVKETNQILEILYRKAGFEKCPESVLRK